MSVIAVASGKGGAGKTTVSVNLACALSSIGAGVQYLDCDVEEPNGSLFLKPEINNERPAYIEVPRIDKDKCTLCGKCAKFCRYHAIAVSDKLTMTFEQLCHSCGGCKLVCPADAIDYIQNEIGVIRKGNANNIEFCDGKMNVGEIHSPALIKNVKQQINFDRIAIIDAPPGTGCAAVEAMKEADYILLVVEPTPFGIYDFELTVKTIGKLEKPFGVFVNKAVVNEDCESYFKEKNYDVLATLDFEKQIAAACSNAELIFEAMPKCKELFENLAKVLIEK